MLLFYAQGLAQNFNGREIFRGVNLEIQTGEKVALVGPNGIGKTSLINIIAGIHHPAAGTIRFFSKTSIAFLTQVPTLEPGQPVRAVLNEPGLSPTAVDEALKRFGFSESQTKPVRLLSGGEKTRLQLARIWLKQPGLLLLDEPTNHLDIEHLNWLEQFVTGYPGTVMMVSHDRYFLDHTVTRILELQPTGLVSYPGNYSEYARHKAAQLDRDMQTFYDQKKQAEKLENAIQAQYQWAAKAHRDAPARAKEMGIRKGGKEFLRAKAKKIDRRAKNTIHRLESLQERRIAKPEESPRIRLSFLAPNQRRQSILRTEGIRKSFGDLCLFQSVNLDLRPAQKVALIGPNGSGKSTLLKIFLGQETIDKGTLWQSPSLKVGYLEQELATLQNERTVITELDRITNNRERAFNLLAGLLLAGEIVHRPCSTLSMGERVKVALVKLLLTPYDLLLLDEPTNFLDLASREKMEEALSAYNGALIIVSHDRYLLDQVCDTVWSITAGTIQAYPGRYTEFTAGEYVKSPEIDSVEEKLRLEYRMALITSELAGLDRHQNPLEYQNLEMEYLTIARKLKS
jgi:macrolide transport system ATP-binding/permease protein